MPAEQFYRPRPVEAPQTDYGGLAPQPTTSPRMEQVVTKLAASHHIDLSQKGATLNLDVPDQQQRWLIGHIDDQRIGVTRLQVDSDNGLTPDLDMVFRQSNGGLEPVEIMHTEAAWQEYAKSTPVDQRGDFNFAAFADTVAGDIAQQALVFQQGEQQTLNQELPSGEPLNQAPEIAKPGDLLSPKERRSIKPVDQVERTKVDSDPRVIGLPVTATAQEIWVRQDMRRRKAVAEGLKWGINPEKAEQAEKEGRDPYPEWERILYRALNLSGVPHDQIPPKELAKRVNLARKIFQKLELENQET